MNACTSPAPERQLAVHEALDRPAWTAPVPEPEIDGAFIDTLVRGRVRNGLRKVRVHHARLWDSRMAGLLDELREERVFFKHRRKLVRRQSSRIGRQFESVSSTAWLVAWPLWAIAQLGALLAMLVAMFAASATGVFKLLLNTAVFADSPVACGILATLATAIPFGIKLGITCIEGEHWRRRVRKLLAWLCTALAIAFLVLLALVTGGLGSALLTSLQLAEPTPVQSLAGLAPHLQWVQLLLELTVALAVYCFIDLLCERHGSPRRSPNPHHWLVQDQWQRAEAAHQQESETFGWTLGARRRLRASRAVFVSRATALYEQQADLARRQEEGIRRQRGETPPDERRGLLARVKRFFRN